MNNNALKKICVVCGFPFPIGYSGTNRIISYTKGLVDYGCDVTVLIYRKTEKPGNILNTNSHGCYKGVKYEYPSKKTVKSIFKVFIVLEQLYDLIITLLKIIKNNHFNVLIISTDDPYLVLLFSIAGAYAKIEKIILIVDEYPKPIRYGGSEISSISKYIFRLAFKKIHGLISISKNILKYYENIIGRSFLSLIVPIIVENERFANNKQKKENFITYVGNLEIQKDGLDILIKSFFNLNQINDKYRLMLIGEGKDKKMLIDLVKSLNISDKVIFKGNLLRDSVPKYLLKSKILCLSRPTSKRAEGGMPTKLGEYLSTGVPVIVTSVGEIPTYLKHKENAYLAQPNDIDNFQYQILSILDNYEEALKIGERGKALALKIFNYKYQSKIILDYLNRL